MTDGDGTAAGADETRAAESDGQKRDAAASRRAALRRIALGETGFERATVWSAVGFALSYVAFDATAAVGVGGAETLLLYHRAHAVFDLDLIGEASALHAVVGGAARAGQQRIGEQQVAVVCPGTDGSPGRVGGLCHGTERELFGAGGGERIAQAARLIHHGHGPAAALVATPPRRSPPATFPTLPPGNARQTYHASRAPESAFSEHWDTAPRSQGRQLDG